MLGQMTDSMKLDLMMGGILKPTKEHWLISCKVTGSEFIEKAKEKGKDFSGELDLDQEYFVCIMHPETDRLYTIPVDVNHIQYKILKE